MVLRVHHPFKFRDLPVSQDNPLVKTLERLNTDIDAFLKAVDYRSYRLRNTSSYLDPPTDPELYKAKRQIHSLYLTLRI